MSEFMEKGSYQEDNSLMDVTTLEALKEMKGSAMNFLANQPSPSALTSEIVKSSSVLNDHIPNSSSASISIDQSSHINDQNNMHAFDQSMDDLDGSPTNDMDENPDDDCDFREQDRFLPIANISRIMKKNLPNNAKIAKDAKETVQECVSEFIAFITSEASDKCQQEKRKTINGDDLLWAMSTLGFDKYVPPLKIYLAKYRESVKGDAKVESNSKGKKDKKDGKSGSTNNKDTNRDSKQNSSLNMRMQSMVSDFAMGQTPSVLQTHQMNNLFAANTHPNMHGNNFSNSGLNPTSLTYTEMKNQEENGKLGISNDIDIHKKTGNAISLPGQPQSSLLPVNLKDVAKTMDVVGAPKIPPLKSLPGMNAESTSTNVRTIKVAGNGLIQESIQSTPVNGPKAQSNPSEPAYYTTTVTTLKPKGNKET